MLNQIKHLNIVLFLLFSNCYTLLSQLPNGSFEEWEIKDGRELPLEWQAYTYDDSLAIQKDTVSFDGNYSLKIRSILEGGFIICIQSIGIRFSRPYENFSASHLKGMVKIQMNDPGDFLAIELDYWESGRFYNSNSHIISEELEDFEAFEIPIEIPNFDSLKMRIYVGDTPGVAADDCKADIEVWLDDLHFYDSTQTEQLELKRDACGFVIYPNPISVEKELNITTAGEGKINCLRLYDSLGRLVKKEVVEHLREKRFELSGLSRGLYYLDIECDQGRELHKIIRL